MTRNALPYLWLPVLAGALITVTGCDPRRAPRGHDGGIGGGDGSVIPQGCTPASADYIHCYGIQAIQCHADGTQGATTDCSVSSQVCVEGQGCQACRPGSFQCSGNDVQACNADGSGWTTTTTCDPSTGLSCNSTAGACTNLCDDAASSNSYIGCEYWPTSTMNPVDSGFDFAVVIANPQSVPANVTVTRSGANVATAMVPAGGIQTVNLPWVDALKTPEDTNGIAHSVLVTGGAYHLVSTVPVTVYQFNPLEYQHSTGTCAGGAGDPTCFSYSNDASLLLPAHVLTGNYIGVSRPTLHQHTLVMATNGSGGMQESYSSTPGFLTIVGTGTGPVNVSVTLKANTAASQDGSVAAGTPGATQTYMLNPGDVLQLASAKMPDSCTPQDTDMQTTTCQGTDIFGSPVSIPCTVTTEYCTVGPEYDLTGTEIQATGPVMVLGGHECDFIPANRWACDHVEETLFPLETWGEDFIVSATQPLRGEPNVIRIISGVNANQISFDPPAAHAPVTLNRGEMVEFEASQDFRVTGSAGAILVAQFLVGQDYAGINTSGAMGQGDPAMSFAIPTMQFRSDYTFLAPDTFESNFVNVTAPVGAAVTIASNGGSPTQVTGWRPVGSTGMQTARVSIPGGTHTMNCSQPFGIVVYGFGSYTSYMYPGGLDLQMINPLG